MGGLSLAQRYAAAGAVAGVVMPVLVLVFGAPVWGGVLAAGAIFFGLSLHAAAAPPGLRAPRASQAAAAAALADARPAVARLERVAEALPKSPTQQRLARLAAAAAGVLDEVAEEPLKLAPAQRLLTYYLPRAAEFAEAHRELRERGMADTARAAAVEEVLARLEQAFARFTEELVDFDMAAIDAELRLVRAALKDDLGPKGPV